jgi:hypothetical protein
MSETRDFPVAVIASISCGTLLCTFSEMHEAAEYLMGHSIWIHHFGSKDLWTEMQQTVLAQCPGMPVSAPDVTPGNWPEFKARLEGELGPVVKIRKGAGLTAMLPTDGIPDHLKDQTIIIKTDPGA